MALLMILILFKKMCNKKSIIIFSSHVRNKILFNKKLSDVFKTLLHYYQKPYPKNVKIWAKLDNLLLNKIFIHILILFCTTPQFLSRLVKYSEIYLPNKTVACADVVLGQMMNGLWRDGNTTLPIINCEEKNFLNLQWWTKRFGRHFFLCSCH